MTARQVLIMLPPPGSAVERSVVLLGLSWTSYPPDAWGPSRGGVMTQDDALLGTAYPQGLRS